MRGEIKLIVIRAMRIVTGIFNMIPLKRNRVVFYAHAGQSYNDNPWYISDFLKKNYGNKFEIVWQFKNPRKYKYLKEEGIIVTGYTSLRGIYYYCTSKICIDDHGPHTYMKRRKNQVIINTWHGGGAYKKVVFDEQASKRYDNDILLKYTFDNISLFISTCRVASERMISCGLRYTGEIMECGMPRNDFLFHEINMSLCRRIKKRLNISDDKKVLLYAPTWRYTDENVQDCIDFGRLSNTLSQCWGGEWVILMRFHPSAIDISPQNTIDVSEYPDMQQLLYISDMLLTDYSSCMWDMSLMYKPIFCYTPDLKQYDDNRGFYVKPTEWGFPLCKTYEELEKEIKTFNLKKYPSVVKHHHEILGIYETGHATESICERICAECGVSYISADRT